MIYVLDIIKHDLRDLQLRDQNHINNLWWLRKSKDGHADRRTPQ